MEIFIKTAISMHFLPWLLAYGFPLFIKIAFMSNAFAEVWLAYGFQWKSLLRLHEFPMHVLPWLAEGWPAYGFQWNSLLKLYSFEMHLLIAALHVDSNGNLY